MLEAMLTGESLQHHCQRQRYIELSLHYLHILYYTGGVFAQIFNELVILKSENLMVFNIKSPNSATMSLNKQIEAYFVCKTNIV